MQVTNINELPQDWDANFQARARGVGIRADRGWPYGLCHRGADPKARLRMVEWAETQGLKLSKGQCLHWLASGRCTRYAECGRRYSWQDHLTGWNIDGKPALLLAQPYQIDGDGIADLAQIEGQGYETHLDTNGWYGCGTITVEIWIPAQRRRSWDIHSARWEARRAADKV